METSVGISSSVIDHICTAEGGISIDPLSANSRSAKCLVKCLASLQDIVSDEFIVPSLFSKAQWVNRHLTNAEMLSLFDSPVQVTKAVNSDRIDTGFFQNKDMVKILIPLKTIQEVSRILFGFANPREERHTILIYDSARLAPEIFGLQDIYSEIYQAKVAKHDDSEINTML